MVEGWLKLYRSIKDHWLWEDKPFSRGQAFIDLLLMANHKDNKILFNGELVEVKRGSRITSLRQLSEGWGWSTKKTKKFLELLEKDKMIKVKTDNKKTLITIENYSIYQSIGNTEETDRKQEGNREENQEKHRGNSKEIQKKTNKNDKERYKNDKERKEGEENTTEPPLPSFPTEAHKKIYYETSDTTYRTWFIDTEITETDNKVTIKANSDFNRGVIEDRFKDRLYYSFLKKIEVI